MQKKQQKNNVGVDAHIDPHFEGITKNNKGITLIALIITIIVMLILVAVSVTAALNGGLFSTAKDATTNTQIARDEELKLDDGQIEVDGKKYASYQDYLDKKPKEEYKTSIEGLAQGVSLITQAELKDIDLNLHQAAEEGKIIAVLKETTTVDEVETTYTAVIPAGFTVSTTDGEDSISKGLVIYDGASETDRNNEFVWIPVTNAASYTEDSFGPLTGTDSTTYVYDSYQEIQYYYGDALGTIDSGDAFNKTFTYAADKTNVETSIQKYGGFYVGRYETTIDNGTIGVQKGKTILTFATLLKEGTNTTSNDEYHYRWWGLYKGQKDMYANNQTVGSLMISSKQWDAIMTYTGYGDTIRPTDTYTTKPDLSGSAYKTDNTKYDVSKNIYDLAGNVIEYTLKAHSTNNRTLRGGFFIYSGFSASDSNYSSPRNSTADGRF